MTLPSSQTVLNKTAGDPDAPSALRYRALNKIAKPQKATLVKILRDCTASPKLRALASLLYADLVEQRAKKKPKVDVGAPNHLGLKQ